jgi:hypothetical protein
MVIVTLPLDTLTPLSSSEMNPKTKLRIADRVGKEKP